jgi:hypothetical protein
MYGQVEGRVLDPEQFLQAWKSVAKALRVNPSFVQVSRTPTMLLSEATKYATYGGRVVDVKQDRVIFLTKQFDEEAVVPCNRWALSFVDRLF